jgi:hypothetical protein
MSTVEGGAGAAAEFWYTSNYRDLSREYGDDAG